MGFARCVLMLGPCSLAAVVSLPAWGDDSGALDLQASATSALQPAAGSPRLFLEAAVGRLSRRSGLPGDDARRASVDFNWEVKPTPQWRMVLSNRLDDIHPVEQGERSTLNSLREAYVSWQDEAGKLVFDLGRMNYRNGPGYGYNPTDYFRDSSLRAVTTADPLAQRENRLGTVMLRAQRLSGSGSLTLALAPKVETTSSDRPMSLDLGATNHSDRVLAVLGGQASDSVSGQGFVFHERGKGAQLGANATALLGNATVAFLEWSGGRDTEVLSDVVDGPRKLVTRHRWVAGATYATSSRLSLTIEFEANGFAASKAEQTALARTGGVESLAAYVLRAQQREDIASRRAVTAYLSQREAIAKNLDITGLLRVNLDDRSTFTWLEARYHLPKVDVALQWQSYGGKTNSEYGSMGIRRLVGALVAAYF